MPIAELLGKTLTKVEGAVGEEQLIFTVDDGTAYVMHHRQDCSESVSIEDICGNLADLVGSPIIQAEESSSQEWPEGVPKADYDYGSFTWTFYRISTAKGLVVIRWYGSSNGYYSESVEFEKVPQ